jgi:hypothetical protein
MSPPTGENAVVAGALTVGLVPEPGPKYSNRLVELELVAEKGLCLRPGIRLGGIAENEA